MKLFISSTIGFLFLLNSCTNDCKRNQVEVQSIMKSWYKKKIIFPTNIEILENIPSKYNGDQIVISQNKYTIVHFFTADCDKCVNELMMIQASLKNNPNKQNVNYLFISSAPSKTYVLNAIKKTKFEYPIYYEKEYFSFKKLNNFPLTDNVYDTMLLNCKKEIILFGAFYDNEKAQSLFSHSINCGL